MTRTSISTPCPAPAGSHRLSIPSAHDDTTRNIEYTRAFEPSLRGTKPRRSSLLHGKAAKNAAPITIFEEVKEDEELVVKQPEGKTFLSLPARKMAAGSGGGQRAGGLREIGQGRVKQPMGKSEPVRETVEGQQQQRTSSMATGRRSIRSEDLFGPAIKKEPRRKTIFIPEDTTVFTIHPGANTTAGLDDTFNINIPSLAVQPAQEEEPNQEEQSQISKPVRRPRKSLAVAPRRAPLVPTRGPENVDGFDVCGDNTGKENLPPAGQKIFKNSPEARAARNIASRPSLYRPTAASQNRQANAPRNAVPLPSARPATTSASTTSSTTQSRPAIGPSSTSSRPTMRQSLTGPSARIPRPQAQRASPKTNVSTTTQSEERLRIRQHIEMKRLEMQASKLQLYPVLSENVSQPELYEDSWLSQQEIALSEVVNEIFGAAKLKFGDKVDPKSVREAMIGLYHQPEVATLHRRLQASLVCGALSKPRIASSSPNPARDIGLRKRFVSLFLETYDEDSLRTAAEVVVGRQVPKRSSASSKGIAGTEEILDPRAGRRALTAFLETFLVSPADIDYAESLRSGDGSDADTIRWRKSILRSIMLIWMLDQAKASGLIAGRLFKKSSSKKSSSAVLNGIASVMMPSVGDITRTLKQMDYEVTHVQDPLDEVDYRVENLAIDLRDGIMLTHLVEILLYSRQATDEFPDDDNATVTIKLPDSTELLSDLYTPALSFNSRMLSQHLKMPCLGHAQKLFNVQVALSTLEGYDIHAANVVGDITADDIVNGHREKTLSLLWSLVSVFGLIHLVDFKELTADLHRATGSVTTIESENSEAISREKQEELLRDWAAAYAAKSDIKINNLTTSFADGKAYAAIIDSFSSYIPSTSGKRASVSSTGTPESLDSRLYALGYSTAFTRQITSTLGVIPSRETVISNLAFLASRLLPLAHKHHAVVIIQRAFRKKRSRIIASQRIALMRLAHDCATIVQTGERVHSATITIQRAWRGVLEARINKMRKELTKFQTLARGWASRRHPHANNASTRVMGGW